jgi:exonuclease VII small subunit
MKTKRQQKKVPKRHRKTRTYKGGDNEPWEHYTKNLNSLYGKVTKLKSSNKSRVSSIINTAFTANKENQIDTKLWTTAFENDYNVKRAFNSLMKTKTYHIGEQISDDNDNDKDNILKPLHASQVVKTLNKEKKFDKDLSILANAIPHMWGSTIAEVIRKMDKDKVNTLFESFSENKNNKKDFQERILFAEVKKDGILYTDKSYSTLLLKKVNLENLIVTPEVVKLLSPEKIQKSENLPDLSEMKEINVASYYKVLANLSPPLLNKLFEGKDGMTNFGHLVNIVKKDITDKNNLKKFKDRALKGVNNDATNATDPLFATPTPTPERFQNVLEELKKSQQKIQSAGGLGEKTYTLQDVMKNIFGSGSKNGVDDKTFIRMMVEMNRQEPNAITPMINYLKNESRAIGRMRGVLQADEEDLNKIVGDGIIKDNEFDMGHLQLDETAVKQLNKTTSIIPNETSPSPSESKTPEHQKTSTQTVEDKNFEEMKSKLYEIINKQNDDNTALETSIIKFYNDNLHNKTELAAKLVDHLETQDNNDTNKYSFAAEVLRKKNTTYFVDLDSFLRIFNPFWPTIETTTLTEENPSVLNRERSFNTVFFANPSYSTNTDQANQDPKTYGYSQTSLRENSGPSTIDFADVETDLRIMENEVTGEKEIKPEFVETYRVETHPNVAHMMQPNPNGSTIPATDTATITSPDNHNDNPSKPSDDQDLIDSLLIHLQNLIQTSGNEL